MLLNGISLIRILIFSATALFSGIALAVDTEMPPKNTPLDSLQGPPQMPSKTLQSSSDGSKIPIACDEQGALKLVVSENFYDRIEGVQALRAFHSDANVLVLMRLLADPFYYLYGTSQKVKKRFPVRQAAELALKSWGVSVSEPLIEETVLLEG